MHSTTLLAACDFTPNFTPLSEHEITFSTPCIIHAFRIVCEGEQPHPEISFQGQTAPTQFSIEIFGCKHGASAKSVCTALLSEPFERDNDSSPSPMIRVVPEAADMPIDYIVIRAPPVPLSICFYGIEVEDADAPTIEPWTLLPAYHSFTGLLNASTEAVLPEAEEVRAPSLEPPARLQRLTLSPLLSPGGVARMRADSSEEDLPTLRKRLEAHLSSDESSEKDRLRVLDALAAALVPPILEDDEEISALARALLAVLGTPLSQRDAGLAELASALGLLAALGVMDAPARALVAAGALPVLLAWLTDDISSGPIRRLVLDALASLLHIPEAMRRFTASSGSAVSKTNSGSDTIAVKHHETSDAGKNKADQQSGYQHVLRLMLDPLPPMLLPSMSYICALAAVWEATGNLYAASEAALQSTVAVTAPYECDAMCAPLLRALGDATVKIHGLSTAAASMSCDAFIADSFGTSNFVSSTTSSGPAFSPGTSRSGAPVRLSLPQARLLGGAGIWHGLLAALTAPCVRASSLLPSTIAAASELLETLLSTLGGVLSLAEDPSVADALISLFPGPPPAAGDLETGKSGAMEGEATANEEKHDVLARPALTLFAAQIGERLRSVFASVQAFSRLVSGQLSALHTLFILEPAGGIGALGNGDPLVTLLASRIGFGVLAACLTPTRLTASSHESAAIIARYAASLLARLLTSPWGGAEVCHEHARWLSTLVARMQTAGFRDEALMSALNVCEAALQPYCFMSAHGHGALCRAIGSLLQSGSNEWLSAFSTSSPDPDVLAHEADFTPKAVSAGGAEMAMKLSGIVLSELPALNASLRALRLAAVIEPGAAVALHEADCLDWLRVILDAGGVLLTQEAAETGDSQRDVLWLLDSAVGIAHALLWQLTQSGLVEHHDTALLEALTSLYLLMPRLPATPLDLASIALRWHETSLSIVSKPGSAGEAALAVEATLLRCLGLFWEGGVAASRVSHLLDRLAGGSPSDVISGTILLARSLPPPLPIAPEHLPQAALLLLPPTPGPQARPALALAIAEDSLLALLPTSSATPDEAETTASGGGAGVGAAQVEDVRVLPLSVDELQQSLLHALHARRELWRSVLLDAEPGVKRLLSRMLSSSDRCGIKALIALLVRLCDLLPTASSKELVAMPLLALQAALGKSAEDPAVERPLSARGDPTAACKRTALLLAALAAEPAGRACLLAADSGLLGAALTAPLGLQDTKARAAGLLLIQNLCQASLSLATQHEAPETPSEGRAAAASAEVPQLGDDLPGLPALGPAAAAIAALAKEQRDAEENVGDDEAGRCAAFAVTLLSQMHDSLMATTDPALRELGQALTATDPASALHAMAADFAEEPAHDQTQGAYGTRLDAESDASRLTIWPHAWQAQCRFAATATVTAHSISSASVSLVALLDDDDFFGTGLVSTELHYALEDGLGEFAGAKRQRTEGSSYLQMNTQGDAPPPVRGGRGRMREENVPLRVKPNTSRPASKHVDDYSGQIGAGGAMMNQQQQASAQMNGMAMAGCGMQMPGSVQTGTSSMQGGVGMQPGKRFQNSSRAPSKHVDDYQAAPVVRILDDRRASAEAPAEAPSQSAPSGAAAGIKSSNVQGGAGRGAACDMGGNAMQAQMGGGGMGPGGPMDMTQMQLMQQLGMAAAARGGGMSGSGGMSMGGAGMAMGMQGLGAGMGPGGGAMGGAMGGMSSNMMNVTMGSVGMGSHQPHQPPPQSNAGPVADAAASSSSSIPPDVLQQLLSDESKLQQFLAENPSMSKEVLRMMPNR